MKWKKNTKLLGKNLGMHCWKRNLQTTKEAAEENAIPAWALQLMAPLEWWPVITITDFSDFCLQD